MPQRLPVGEASHPYLSARLVSARQRLFLRIWRLPAAVSPNTSQLDASGSIAGLAVVQSGGAFR